MNLFEITCSEFAVQIMNKRCYIPPIIDSEPMVRRTVELRQQILEDLFGMQLLTIDEEDFLR
jgi:hypothetical protein